MKQILDLAGRMLGRKPSELICGDSVVRAKAGSGAVTYSEIALHALHAADQHQIGALSSHITHKSPPPFCAHFVEVEIDTETRGIRVLRYVAAVDCGTPIHPKLADSKASRRAVDIALAREAAPPGVGAQMRR